MTNNTEDVELRGKLSDQLANLIVKASLEKLNGDGDILKKGRRYISMHNEELWVIMHLIQQEANRQVIKELEWAKTASVWNIEARVKELKEQTNGE